MTRHNAIIPSLILGAALAFSGSVFSKTPDIQPGVNYAPGTVLVKFRPGTPAQDKANARASLGATLERSYTIVPGLELLVSQTRSVPELMARLSRNPNIEFVEPDYEVSAGATYPNDPRMDNLWGMHRIGAPNAWDATTGSQEYVIAVIDSGVDQYHQDLAANMWVNPGEVANNGVDDDGNGYVDDVHGYDFYNNDGDPWDDNGHGTHVAGTICGRGNNGTGVAGVNWQCRIMALKFLGRSGSGSTSAAVAALEYAVAQGVRVSNNSWGGGGYSSSLAQALTAAGNAEHLFAAAAGNSGLNNDSSPHYPSSYAHDNVIAVASTQSNDAMSGFSNYGLNSVDLGAPGSSILSSVPNDGYSYYSGTSMATPHVAGAVALLASYNPGWSAQQLKDTILATVEPLPSLDGRTLTGGLLDVAAAIAASPGGGGGDNQPPTAEFSFSTSHLTADFTDSSTDPEGNIASRSWDFDDGNASSETNPSHTYACAGDYYVALTVTDDVGGSDTAIHPVLLHPSGNMAPVITAPADITVEATGETTAVDLGTPVVEDDVDCSPSVTNDAPAGFPVGVTTVTWTATDAAGNSASDTQTVTVTEPPPQAPAAPTNLTASVDKSGRGKNKVVTGVILSWTDNSGNETQFIIEGCAEVSQGKGKNRTVTCDYSVIGSTGPDVTSFDATGAYLNSGYDHFRVRAENGVGASDWSNEVKI